MSQSSVEYWRSNNARTKLQQFTERALAFLLIAFFVCVFVCMCTCVCVWWARVWCDTGVCCACACVFGAHVNLVHFFFFGWCHFNKCKTTTKLVEKFIPPRRRPCVSVATQRRINQLLIKALSTRVRRAFTNGQRKLKLNRYWHHNPCDLFSSFFWQGTIEFNCF